MNKKLIAIICAVTLFNQALLTKDTIASTNEDKVKETNLYSDFKVNGSPEIVGTEDKDIYVGQRFNPEDDVDYISEDDFIISTRVSGDYVDTQVAGEYTLKYSATDTKGRTTVVNRKITVRPHLYKNVIKVYSQINNSEQNKEYVKENKKNILKRYSYWDEDLYEDWYENDILEEDNPWLYEENKDRKPAFEVGFDTVNKKYKVFNQTDEQLSKTNLSHEAFTLEIRDWDGNLKKKITLTGGDKGTSSKLSELNSLDYDLGDIIRVYRSELNGIEISGDVEGDVPDFYEMESDSDKFDYMKNTVFAVTNGGLEATYIN